MNDEQWRTGPPRYSQLLTSTGSEGAVVDDREQRVSSWHSRTIVNDGANRMLELEAENAGLRRLIAELLIKNQQLREAEGSSKQHAEAADVSKVHE